MEQRFSALLEERGFKSDEIEAVLAARLRDVRNALDAS